MNKVCINGRLIKDPELKIFNNSTSLCTFFIANETLPGKNKNTGLYKCSAWGKPGRSLAYHAEKGSEVSITGRLHQKKNEDKNGNTIYEVSIIVENFSLRNNTGSSAVCGQTAVSSQQGDLS